MVYPCRTNHCHHCGRTWESDSITHYCSDLCRKSGTFKRLAKDLACKVILKEQEKTCEDDELVALAREVLRS